MPRYEWQTAAVVFGDPGTSPVLESGSGTIDEHNTVRAVLAVYVSVNRYDDRIPWYLMVQGNSGAVAMYGSRAFLDACKIETGQKGKESLALNQFSVNSCGDYLYRDTPLGVGEGRFFSDSGVPRIDVSETTSGSQ